MGTHFAHLPAVFAQARRKTMLTFVFFLLAVAAAIAGVSGLAEAGLQQYAALAVAVLFLALAGISISRNTRRPWRER
jgi:SNF family Na+-dependent transporter